MRPHSVPVTARCAQASISKPAYGSVWALALALEASRRILIQAVKPVGAAALGLLLAPTLFAQNASQATSGQYYRARPVAKIAHFKLAPAYPDIDAMPEAAADTSLADAISEAYRTNPTLQAARYDLRATDENLGLALSELRPSSELQFTTQYNKTVPGRVTQATRFATSPIITSNSLGGQFIVNQPISTGGKASADIAAANAAIRAGRAGLEATEGDLLLRTISAYMDIRRDTRELAIRKADLGQLEATLEEVYARREAGELTKTDIAQTETQIQSAEGLYNQTRAQLEDDRATYASLVGIDPGHLAPAPPLPQLPATIDEAVDAADRLNPDLAGARFTEASSREKIAAARAANHPTLALQGTVGLTGQMAPFYLHNDDQSVTVQGVLTIPLTSGGHNGAAIHQAENTNSGDRLRIEAARRAMLLNIANAWNQMTSNRRNVQVAEAQVKSGRVYYEGSFAEYRAGLRSTFDVLYAQEALLGAEVTLETARHDLYVAEASLLRYVGLMDVRALTTGVGLYDASADIRHIENRGEVPWGPHVRDIDRIARPNTRTRALTQPPLLHEPARPAPVTGPPPADDYMTSSAGVPQPGTAGRPTNEASH